MARKTTDPSRVPRNAVLLSKVSSLTLRRDQLTKSRRVDAVPQLECVGPEDICKRYNVDVMRCTNEGADYEAESVQWSCKASLPEDFKLGSTEVVCEGYESSDDPYVLKGSCGVEYRLLLTDKGELKYGSGDHQQHRQSMPNINLNLGKRTTVAGTSAIFFLIFAVVLFIILKGFWSSWNESRNRPRLPRPQPRGGYGNDDNDPPPPYDGPPPYYSQPRYPNTKSSTQSSTSTRASSSRTTSQQGQNSQSWRPGFWTGAAAGAAAGYYGATRGQSSRQSEARSQPETRERSGGGGWFSGFGSSSSQNSRRTSSRPGAPAPPSPPSTSEPTYSATRHESTGFGGTRRR